MWYPIVVISLMLATPQTVTRSNLVPRGFDSEQACDAHLDALIDSVILEIVIVGIVPDGADFYAEGRCEEATEA